MTVLKRVLSAAALVSGVVAPAWAQAPDDARKPPSVQVGFGLLMGGPIGEFGRNVEDAGGLSGHLDFALGASPVSVGVEAAYLLYGSESRDVDLGPAIPELSGTTVRVTTDNQMVLVHGRFRVQRRHGRWRPYVDGLAGFNYISTSTSIDDTDCSGSWCSGGGIGATNLSDYVPSFGATAGVMWDVAGPGGTRLDFSLRYLWGGEGSYLKEGAIHRVGNQALFDVSRSRTDMILFYVGLNFGR